MIRTQLQTERLRLRLFTLADVQIMFELNSDPEIIKYAEATPARDLQEARQRLEQGSLIHIYDVDAIQYEMML